MKFYTSALSPFARKVDIFARLHGLELERIDATKSGSRGYDAGGNPLGKVPALVTNDGTLIVDSFVICEYLDALSSKPLLVQAGDGHWTQKTLHKIGDGLAEAVYNYRYETVRDASLHWDTIITRHITAIEAVLAYLETHIADLGTEWNFGNIAVICALDYMQFRADRIDYKAFAPKLHAWHKGFASQPHYQSTYAYV